LWFELQEIMMDMLARFVCITLPCMGRAIIVLIPSSRDQAALIRAAYRFSNLAAHNKNREARWLRDFYGAASQI
jgi:hypothetical protein